MRDLRHTAQATDPAAWATLDAIEERAQPLAEWSFTELAMIAVLAHISGSCATLIALIAATPA